MVIFYILLSTFVVSLISFAGVLTLLLKERLLNKILLALVAFSAGALLGGAFFHLLPEAIEKAGLEESVLLKIFLWLISGFCLFFVLEQFIKWHHHHSKDHSEICAFSYLVLVSDAVHNFIDGLIISASFIIAAPLGWMTVAAVALHEIPQEIGDFAVLIYGGFKKTKALFVNFLSGLWAVLGGVWGFLLAEKIGKKLIFLLPFAAGAFIYIACSDLIPEIKNRANFKKSIGNFLIFLLGLFLMLALKLYSG